ncbi:unnamed protein product [Sphagnum balticum]
MVNDSISDMLTRIRNGCLAKKNIVSIPYTRSNQQIAQILEKEGGAGIVIISTPVGIITDREARLRGVGGEILCSVW